MRFILVVAAFAAGMFVDLRPAPAAHRHPAPAPWCAVVQVGPEDLHWDCSYATFQACVPHVLAGNRGFCEENPYAVTQLPRKRRVLRR